MQMFYLFEISIESIDSSFKNDEKYSKKNVVVGEGKKCVFGGIVPFLLDLNRKFISHDVGN